MLMDIIKSRHSIRKYTDKQIRKTDLEKILEYIDGPQPQTKPRKPGRVKIIE